jgi:steroid Delta-isomerase
VNAVHQAAVARIERFFSQLTPVGLDDLTTVYHAQARFADPFNDVRGVGAIRTVFEHMYQSLGDPRFEIRQSILQDADCVVLWDFLYRLPAKSTQVHRLAGASHLRLNAEGLIVQHVDYWDPALGIYEKLPLIGAVARALRRRAAG